MIQRKQNLRNIVIIAHVDHGKTTLVDAMLKQSGIYRENQEITERVMDSLDLERERGITILAKNTAIFHNGVKINIVDTPGHADFGGEVERGLNLVDGAILLVDAAEGPLPQTRFVVKKALAKKLAMIVVINKIDRTDARPKEVLDEIYDLFIDLGADEHQIEFPVLYTIARSGVCHKMLGDDAQDLKFLFEAILSHIPGPQGNDSESPQFLVTNLDYDPYVGQVAIGRIVNGILEMNKVYALCGRDKIVSNVKFSALYTFQELKKKPVSQVEAGDIIAVAGVDNITIGDSITESENPRPLPRLEIDEPTISMIFYVNNSPFSGKEGKFLTSRHLRERLEKEALRNVAIKIKYSEKTDAFEVCGRGELQMAILIETMRREGYEMMVSKPRVLTKQKNGTVLEPYEHMFLDVPEQFIGILTEKLSQRKGKMTHLENNGSGRVTLEFEIPTRGLIGFRSQFMTDTKGAGVMNTLLEGFKPWCGPIPQRTTGALVADRGGKVTTYASLAMTDRGDLFVEVGRTVYGGMIVGERNREGDLEINIAKEKKLTNVRAASKDATVVLRPTRLLSLDQAIEFIAEDEVVEVTPQSFRLRKMELEPGKRAVLRKRDKSFNDEKDGSD